MSSCRTVEGHSCHQEEEGDKECSEEAGNLTNEAQ
jgi:hypothetical protein